MAIKPPRRRAGLVSRIAELDARISRWFFFGGKGGARTVLKMMEVMGSGWVWFPLPIAVLLSGQATDLQKWVLSNLVAGFLLDVACVGALKALCRRQRPPYNDAGDMDLTVAVDRFSFPSGHTSRATMIALVGHMCLAGSQDVSARWGVVAWGALTSFSRIGMGRHYVGDVVAGCALGFGLVAALTRGRFEVEGLPIPREAAATLVHMPWEA